MAVIGGVVPMLMTSAAVIIRLRLIMAVVVLTELRGQKRRVVMPGPSSRIVRGGDPVGVGCPVINQHDKHEQQSCHAGHATTKDANFGGECHRV